jgi:hypothetical protein
MRRIGFSKTDVFNMISRCMLTIALGLVSAAVATAAQVNSSGPEQAYLCGSTDAPGQQFYRTDVFHARARLEGAIEAAWILMSLIPIKT